MFSLLLSLFIIHSYYLSAGFLFVFCWLYCLPFLSDFLQSFCILSFLWLSPLYSLCDFSGILLSCCHFPFHHVIPLIQFHSLLEPLTLSLWNFSSFLFIVPPLFPLFLQVSICSPIATLAVSEYGITNTNRINF